MARPFTVEALRAYGARPLRFRLSDASVEGRIVQERLGAEPIMLLIARDDGSQLVLPLADVEAIEER